MAFYDPVKDIIIGAEPGSLAYRHEEGHRASRGFGLLTLNLFPHLIIISIGSLAYGKPLIAQVGFWCWIALVLINELYAWGYAVVGLCSKPKI